MKNVLTTKEVLILMKEALSAKRPLSLSRFGHGEITYAIWPEHKYWRKRFRNYRDYAGARCSSRALNKALIQSLMDSDIVGFHIRDSEPEVDKTDKFFVEITEELLQKLDYTPEYVCSARVTQRMIEQLTFSEILKQHKVALVGRRAKEAIPFFKELGINIVMTTPLEGYQQIEEVCETLSNDTSWDIALLSAGIPATILAPKLSKKSSRVVIDFGHALDMFMDGETFDEDKLINIWKQNLLPPP